MRSRFRTLVDADGGCADALSDPQQQVGGEESDGRFTAFAVLFPSNRLFTAFYAERLFRQRRTRPKRGRDGPNARHHHVIVLPGLAGMTALIRSILRLLLVALRELMASYFAPTPVHAEVRPSPRILIPRRRSAFAALPPAAWAAP